jgi:LysM repeat protein
MNNENPLNPQGSALEQKNEGRARLKIAVFFGLTLHGVVLMAFLMQGCGQTKETQTPTENTISNPPPTFVETTNQPETTSAPPVVVTQPVVPVTPPPPPIVPAAGASEYTIVKGDTLAGIAKKSHVSVKALTEANPGLVPTKLKIGQKVQIPAAAAPSVPVVSGTAPVESASAGGEAIYTVKSGDNLTKIAAHLGTTVKALRAANSLKTDSIKVGQKLKVPAKASSSVTAPVVPVEPAPTVPTTPLPSTPPAR